MRRLEYRILGHLEVLDNGRPLNLAAAKQRALLAVLLLHANELVPTDRLVDALWGERPPETAQTALRVYVSELRKLVGPDRLVTRSPGYVLHVGPDELDLVQFERLVEAAVASDALTQRARLLREALKLWRGEPLADLPHEGFAQREIARLDERRLAALEERLEAELGLGRHADLVAELELLVAENPLRERFRSQLMLALYRSGRQAEALEAYRDASDLLLAELGIQPSPALRFLQKQILMQDASLELTRQSAAAAPTEEPVENQNRFLTVLVADVGAPEDRTLDRDELDDILDDAVRAMAEAVVEHGGEVASAVDNSVLGLFGTSSAREDDPERAVLAALTIRSAAQARGLAASSAVSTGKVLVGHRAGGALAAHGPALECALALKLAAEPGRILVPEETYDLVRSSFEFERLPLRGDGSATTYDARAPLLHPQKTRGIEGRRADLQGREQDIKQLRNSLADVLEARGRLIVITGEAGIGKSRLVSELSASAPDEVLWLEGRCRASGAGTAYLPYREILQAALGWTADESDWAREQRLVAALDDLVRVAALTAERRDEIVPVLGKLLLVRLSRRRAAPLESITPEQLRNQTFTAARDFLVALARSRPLVLVLEDLHWADSLSVDLTSLLMEAVGAAPLLLVCVVRPEPEHASRRLLELGEAKAGASFVQIQLGELSREQSLGLLHALVSTESLPRRLEEQILTLSQGNPFYLEEIVHSLVDAAALARENGSRNTLSDAESFTVPNSVQSVIVSRIDQLEQAHRRVLQVASVLGRSFPRELLGRLVDATDDFDRSLWELQRRDLVLRDHIVPEEAYSFNHVLTQETIYAGIPSRRRHQLHQRAADTIEAVYADSIDEHYEQLAYHCERGTASEKAAEYLFRAGEKARLAYLNEEALAYLRRALAQLGRLSPETVQSGWLRDLVVDTFESLGDLLELTGARDEAIDSYGQASAGLQDDVVRAARLQRKIASAHRFQRRVDESLEAFDRAETILGDDPTAREAEWWEERAEIALGRVMLLYFWGEANTFDERVGETRALVESHGTPLQRGRIRFREALASLRRNRFVADERTLSSMRSALAAAEESANLSEILSMRFSLGFALLLADRIDAGEAQLLDALALAERIGDAVHRSRCRAYLALAHRKRGDLDETRRCALEAIETSEAAGMVEYVAHARANLAWVAWREGDLTAAEENASAAWQGWGFGQFQVMAWMPLWPLIGVALRRGDIAGAAVHLRLLLEPTRQPLPADVVPFAEAAAAAADRADWDVAREHLERAAAAAVSSGSL